VLFENQTYHAHCPVVLDSLNIGTLTDSSGYYEIFLPDSLSGINGTFKLYFYLYDYELDSLSATIKDGKVLWSAADVLEDGTLKTITLKQLLSIYVTSEKERYKAGEQAKFHYTLTNTSNRTFFTTPNYTEVFYDITLKRAEWFVPQDPVPSQSTVEPKCSYYSGSEFKFKKPGKGYFIVFFNVLYELQIPFLKIYERREPSAVASFLLQLEEKNQYLVNSGGPFFVFINDSKNLHFPIIEIIE
jgi:hypothetical protein